MKKAVGMFLLVAILLVGNISYVQAITSKVTVKVDIGTNVLIRVKDISTDAVLETPKITNYGTGVAITEFTTSRPKVSLLVLLLEDGNVIYNDLLDSIKVEPEIMLDYRSDAPIQGIITEEEVVVEEVVEEVAVAEEEVVEETSTETSTETTGENVDGITGNAIFYKADGTLNWFYVVILGSLTLVILFFLVKGAHSKRRKKKAMNPEEQELEDLQKKVREKGNEIRMIREEKNRKKRIQEAKKRLAEEEKILNNMGGQQNPATNAELQEAKKRLEQREKELAKLRSQAPSGGQQQTRPVQTQNKPSPPGNNNPGSSSQNNNRPGNFPKNY